MGVGTLHSFFSVGSHGGIGDVEAVAEKLVAEIHATKPTHVCFSFKVGDTPHAAAMRSMELMMGEVKPRVERALGPVEHAAAE